VLAAFVSSRIGVGSSPLGVSDSPVPLPFAFPLLPVAPVSVFALPVPVLLVPVVVPDDFGVGAVNGILGGLVVPSGDLAVVGVVSAGVVVGAGVIAVVPGVVGMVAVVGAWATVITLGAGFCVLGWVSAAYAAAPAPSTNTVVTPSTAVAERQPGPPVCRLPGAAVPHCRHQS